MEETYSDIISVYGSVCYLPQDVCCVHNVYASDEKQYRYFYNIDEKKLQILLGDEQRYTVHCERIYTV